MKSNDRFLKACRHEPVDATPVWLMRQAGRYMSEYRLLREKHSILECIKTPELAAEITFQPVKAFDLDAAIIFADILTLPEAMGLQLEFIGGEGPKFHNPIRHTDDLDRLRDVDPAETLGFTVDAIKLVTQELDGRLPLIGFSGAPFTLACYAIEGSGSRHFALAKAFMYRQPEAWHRLLDRLATTIGQYLAAQAAAGAAALQLFDSWVGILSPQDYAEYVLPHTQKALALATAEHKVPCIHFGTETATLLPAIATSGANVIGVDWRIALPEAWSLVGSDKALQGNLDPTLLFGPPEHIRQATRDLLDTVKGQTGHIFNLGHGVLPRTPTEHVAELIDEVHRYTAADTAS